MSQFIIQANDFIDADALTRRMEARPYHLQRMKEEKQKDVFIMGGALLNDDDKMIGSVLIVALPDGNSVLNWIGEDPYMTSSVWNEIIITPFRVADV